MGVTRIESNRNRHFGLKIESKSIENRNLEIVTSLWYTADSIRRFDSNEKNDSQVPRNEKNDSVAV